MLQSFNLFIANCFLLYAGAPFVSDDYGDIIQIVSAGKIREIITEQLLKNSGRIKIIIFHFNKFRSTLEWKTFFRINWVVVSTAKLSHEDLEGENTSLNEAVFEQKESFIRYNFRNFFYF